MAVKTKAELKTQIDTVAASVVATHIKVNAYFWKP